MHQERLGGVSHPMHDEFDNPFGITKTLAMMTGELDFGDTFGDKDKYRQLLLAIFVISVTIVISASVFDV